MFAAEQIDLSGAWSRVWVQMQAGLTPGFMQLLTAVGVLLVVGAIVKALWDKRRGQGGGGMGREGGQLLWVLVLGCLFAAPGLILPIFLVLADAVANALVSIFGSSGV